MSDTVSPKKSMFKKADITKISLKDFEKRIPPNAKPLKNMDLENTHTEWRWRIFKIDEKYILEMSYKKPNEKRMFLNKFGNWILYDENTLNIYNEFVIKVLYDYVIDPKEK